MGKRKARQEELIVTRPTAKSLGHPFYHALNRSLTEADFDRWIECRCQRYYEQEEKCRRPSIPPGVYFRISADRLLLGRVDNHFSVTRRAASQAKPRKLAAFFS